MKLKGGGKIIKIGSMFSLFGGLSVPAYSASMTTWRAVRRPCAPRDLTGIAVSLAKMKPGRKGGIVQLTKSLATAWAAGNIQVNAVLPGWINTDLIQRARERRPDLRSSRPIHYRRRDPR